MKFPLSFLLFFFVLFNSGCATKSFQPEWISGDSAKYKNSQYLLGRGEASTMDEAKDRARADLAKTFKVAVSVDSQDMQSYKSNSATGSGKYVTESSVRISTSTDQIIRGIQIAELWQDPVRKNHHALAILPRQQAAISLKQQVTELDDAIQGSVNQSKNNTDLLIKIAAANKALETQLERDGLQKALQVVDASGRGVESKYSSHELKSDLDDLLKRVRVAPKVLGGSTPGVEEIVAGALSHAGFLIETGEKPDFLLKASLVLTDVGLKDGWYWQRGNLDISMSEAASGRVRGTQRWQIKSSATDKATAIRRALNEADSILKKELGPSIIGMTTGR